MQTGLLNMASGTNFLVEQGNFVVETANELHEGLERAIQIGSLVSLGVAAGADRG